MNRAIAGGEAAERSVTRIDGNLAVVRSRRLGPSASLEADMEADMDAELGDGRDVIRLVWLGQRRITGIEPGAAVAVEGRLAVHRGRKTIFNPRYELTARRSGS